MSAWSSRGLALTDTFILPDGTGTAVRRWAAYTLAVQLTDQNDLTLCDVSGQVRDGMGLVILRHGQDRDHGDGTVDAFLLPARSYMVARSVYR